MDDRQRVISAVGELAQKGGYSGFLLSDVATLSGVDIDGFTAKFGSKDDLVAEVMRNYHTDFFAALSAAPDQTDSPQKAFERFIEIVRDVLVTDNRMCLCGMLAADTEMLPETVREQAADFMAASIDWLEARWRDLGHADPHDAAVNALARLEGGMLLSRVGKDTKHFDTVANDIRSEIAALG